MNRELRILRYWITSIHPNLVKMYPLHFSHLGADHKQEIQTRTSLHLIHKARLLFKWSLTSAHMFNLYFCTTLASILSKFSLILNDDVIVNFYFINAYSLFWLSSIWNSFIESTLWSFLFAILSLLSSILLSGTTFELSFSEFT